MDKKEGLFVYRLDTLFTWNGITNICTPLIFDNKDVKVLYYDGDKQGWDNNTSFVITDYLSKTEHELYAEIDYRFNFSPPFKDCIRELIPVELGLGVKFPLIYRPLFYQYPQQISFIPFDDNKPAKEYYKDPPIDNLQEYSNSLRQLEIILDDLEAVFKVVAPSSNNMNTYGNAIRNIIIMACTEIDMLMKYTLKRNGISLNDYEYDTKQYVKLFEPWKLNEYQLCLSRYGLGFFSPFLSWNKINSTKSIKWYDEYNKVKHDREGKFELANLDNAINSVMALAIVLISQYGYRNDLWNEKVGRIIRVNKEPQWEIKDFYFPPFEGNSIVEKHYSFK